MLIEDSKLNVQYFKDNFKSYEWLRVPRSLGPDHKEFFYIASFEDEDWKISIKTRPSMIMAITESYKHCDIRGNKVPRDYEKQKYNFGTTVEVKVTEQTLEEIKKVAKPIGSNKLQELSL